MTKNRDDILYPKQISIETFHGCNARCVFCSIDSWQKTKGPMSEAVFSAIIGQVRDWGPDHLKQTGLTLNGEPLLDPKLPERIQCCKSMNLPNVGFTTQGSLLTPEKTDLIIEAAPDYVVFSFDTLHKEPYERHRKQLNHDMVMENILSFIKKRNYTNGTTRIVLRHIDYTGDKNEFDEYRRHFQDLLQEDLDEIGYTKLHNASVRPSSKWQDDTLPEGNYGSTECNAPFNRLTIKSNGDVVLCPNDFNAVYTFGNVLEKHVLDIFNCEAFNKIRAVHKGNRRNTLEKCNSCDEPELNADGEMYIKFTPSGKKFFANVFEGFDHTDARENATRIDKPFAGHCTDKAGAQK